MRVILLQPIKGLGHIGEVKDIRDGYAKNFLLPRKLAIPATKENLKKLQAIQKKRELHERESREQARAIAEKLHGVIYTIQKKANEEGTLYDGVDKRELAEFLAANGIHIAPEHLQILAPIKTVGEHAVSFKYDTDIKADFTVIVEKEKEKRVF